MPRAARTTISWKSRTFGCIAVGVVAATGALGCGSDSDEPLEPIAGCTDLTYENFGSTFISQHCIACHSSQTSYPEGEADEYDFDTLAGVREHGNDMLAHAVNGVAPVMPPEGQTPLTDEQKAELEEWLSCGAPSAEDN